MAPKFPKFDIKAPIYEPPKDPLEQKRNEKEPTTTAEKSFCESPKEKDLEKFIVVATSIPEKKKPPIPEASTPSDTSSLLTKRALFVDKTNLRQVSEDNVRRDIGMLYGYRSDGLLVLEKTERAMDHKIIFDTQHAIKTSFGDTHTRFEVDNKFKKEINVSRLYYDHVFTLEIPFTQDEIDSGFYNLDKTQLEGKVGKIEPTYNHFLKNYEVNIKNKEINERILPNIHFLYAESSKRITASQGIPNVYNVRYWKHATLSNHLSKHNGFFPSGGNALNPRDSQLARYFELYGTQVDSIIRAFPQDVRADVENPSRNIYSVSRDIEEITDASERFSRIFPMMNLVRIPTFAKKDEKGILNILDVTATEGLFQAFVGNEIRSKRINSYPVLKYQQKFYRQNIGYKRGFAWQVAYSTANNKFSNIFDFDQEQITVNVNQSNFSVSDSQNQEQTQFLNSINNSTTPLSGTVIANPDVYVDVVNAGFVSSKTTPPPFKREGKGTNFYLKDFEEDLLSWDVTAWWNQYVNTDPNKSNPNAIKDPMNISRIIFGDQEALENSIFLGDFERELSKIARTNPFKGFSFMLFSNLSQDFIKNKVRSVEELFTGKKAHSETIFYKIEKLDATSNELLQSFYMPTKNYSKTALQEILYADSQVKFGKKYKYTIKAYVMVVGSQYSYYEMKARAPKTTAGLPKAGGGRYTPTVHSDAQNGYEVQGGSSSHPSGSTPKRTIPSPDSRIPVSEDPTPVFIKPDFANAQYFLHHSPSMMLFEVPIFEQILEIQDNPPMPPEVSFHPYHDDNESFLLYLQPGLGEIMAKPIFIDEDKERGNDKGKKVRFKSDDPVSRYEVYRTEERPSNYRNFKGLGKVIEAKTSTSVSIIENIRPNKDYWYTFRSVDVHKKYSNPSPIYKVRMVDDSGFYFLDIKVEKEEGAFELDLSKHFGKKLSFVPKSEQLSLEKTKIENKYSQDVTKNDILMGENNKLWDKQGNSKTYKFRIRSKKTGKVIDINVKYKYEIELPFRGSN